MGLSNWILKYVFNVRINEKKDSFSRIDLETLYQESEDGEFEPDELNTELFENAKN
jgi:hypothetical protein